MLEDFGRNGGVGFVESPLALSVRDGKGNQNRIELSDLRQHRTGRGLHERARSHAWPPDRPGK